jgi:hypothetical protein
MSAMNSKSCKVGACQMSVWTTRIATFGKNRDLVMLDKEKKGKKQVDIKYK